MTHSPEHARHQEESPAGLRDRFNEISDSLNQALGSLWAVGLAVLVVLVWALTGPIFNFSDTWQLVINTSTTIVTFWMVFVIQNSQNRNARAVHVKLDEIIRSLENARNEFITTEKATEAEMETREEELREVASEHPSPADRTSRVQRR
jgi:low affinity Fe/Cu permease